MVNNDKNTDMVKWTADYNATCETSESFRNFWLSFSSSFFCKVAFEAFIFGLVLEFIKTVLIIDVESVVKIFSE